jgi:DNA-binding MarR family transcriptional regulator
VLAALRRSGRPYTLTSSALARTVMMSRAGMTGRLDRLEEQGLIARAPDADDRRSFRISLTARGRRTVDAAVDDHGSCSRSPPSTAHESRARRPRSEPTTPPPSRRRNPVRRPQLTVRSPTASAPDRRLGRSRGGLADAVIARGEARATSASPMAVAGVWVPREVQRASAPIPSTRRSEWRSVAVGVRQTLVPRVALGGRRDVLGGSCCEAFRSSARCAWLAGLLPTGTALTSRTTAARSRPSAVRIVASLTVSLYPSVTGT